MQKDRQILGSCQTAEKVVEHEGDVHVDGAIGMVTKDQEKSQNRLAIREKNRDHLNFNNVKFN